MKNRIIAAMLLCLPLLTACSDDSKHPSPPVVETTVRLVGAIATATRAVIGSDYADDLDVCFARQDETAVSAGAYGAWSIHRAVRSGGAGNRPIAFAEVQLYPSDGRSIRLHGYYPAVGATSVDAAAGRVVFVIDGATDLMATGCLVANTYAPVGSCTFRHLLTQIQLVCYSDVPEDWGEITHVEALGIHTLQQLELSDGLPSLTDVSPAERIGNIPVGGIAGLSIPRVVELQKMPDPQGVVLLPALSAGGAEEGHAPLRLQIVTTRDGKGGEVATVSNVSIAVADGFRVGKRHIVSLFFTRRSQIKPSLVGVEPWTESEQEEIPI